MKIRSDQWIVTQSWDGETSWENQRLQTFRYEFVTIVEDDDVSEAGDDEEDVDIDEEEIGVLNTGVDRGSEDDAEQWKDNLNKPFPRKMSSSHI